MSGTSPHVDADEHVITVNKMHPMLGDYYQALCSCGGGVTHLYRTPEEAEQAACEAVEAPVPAERCDCPAPQPEPGTHDEPCQRDPGHKPPHGNKHGQWHTVNAGYLLGDLEREPTGAEPVESREAPAEPAWHQQLAEAIDKRNAYIESANRDRAVELSIAAVARIAPTWSSIDEYADAVIAMAQRLGDYIQNGAG